MEFQPTLPARGATKQFGNIRTFVEISTHAPRTGSDGESAPASAPLRHFNPRSPHGERQRGGKAVKNKNEFQPTLPARGATGGRGRPKKTKSISTHAPRTGSDWRMRLACRSRRISTHAPRTGSDNAPSCVENVPKLFQPTLPARGATIAGGKTAEEAAFQPTLPARGATKTWRCWLRHPTFQPTLPARGATARR